VQVLDRAQVVADVPVRVFSFQGFALVPSPVGFEVGFAVVAGLGFAVAIPLLP
jgi:hypothetical protein